MTRRPTTELAHLVCMGCLTSPGYMFVTASNGKLDGLREGAKSECCNAPLELGSLLSDKELNALEEQRREHVVDIMRIQQVRKSITPWDTDTFHVCLHVDMTEMWIGWRYGVDDDGDVNLQFGFLGLLVHFLWPKKSPAPPRHIP